MAGGGMIGGGMNTEFVIGLKTITADEVFAAYEPTREEMAAFCNTLGLLIENYVPILESFRLTAECTQHPWLIAILSEIHIRVREGECISGAAVSGLKKLVSIRVAELSRSEILEQEWEPTEPTQWAIPNFFGFFKEFIALLSAGEEAGQPCSGILRVRDINLQDGKVSCYEDICGREVAFFCSTFELMHTAGIPKLSCLKLMREYSSLQHEIDIAIWEMENGSSLAEAFQKTGGQLANPAFVAMIDAGECGEKLAMTLISMVED